VTVAYVKKIAKAIQANPGCVAVIDNDCWWLYKEDPCLLDERFTDDEWEAADKAEKANVLASGTGPYGSELLYAMADILGVTLLDV
jgi:hypothetical protein